MNKIKEILKFKVLPKKLYLKFSARNKYRRADKSQEPELRLLQQIVNKNMTAVDIGANTGLYTYYLSIYAKTVIAFEPHTLFANFLTKAVADNVVVINKGLSNNNIHLPFYIPLKSGHKQMNIASFNKSTVQDTSYVKQMIEVVTLDSMKFTDVGYIKIDVEGHEHEVLEGAIETIESQKPVIQVEILGKQEEKAGDQALNYIKGHGYGIYVYLDKQLREFDSVDPSRFGKNFICLPI